MEWAADWKRQKKRLWETFEWVLGVFDTIADLTPIIISMGQLVANDGSDPAIVHRPTSRNGDDKYVQTV